VEFLSSYYYSKRTVRERVGTFYSFVGWSMLNSCLMLNYSNIVHLLLVKAPLGSMEPMTSRGYLGRIFFRLGMSFH